MTLNFSLLIHFELGWKRMRQIFFLHWLVLLQRITPQTNLASSSDTKKSCSHTKYRVLPCQPTSQGNYPKIVAVKFMGNPELPKGAIRCWPSPQLQLTRLTYSWLPPLHCRNKKLGLVCLFFGELRFSAGPGISCKGVVPRGRASVHCITHIYAQKSCHAQGFFFPIEIAVSAQNF